MAWNGSGTYTRTNGTNSGSSTWADDATAGTKITASNHDTHDEDLATAINACLTKNNETKPTAHFDPNAGDTYDLGDATLTWRNLYASGDLVVKEQADHQVTPAAGYGQFWVKDDAPNVPYFTDDAGTDHKLVVDSEATNHVRCGYVQLYDAGTTKATFDVDSNITENTFETIGPTGSGATNIWASMDDMPSTAKAIIVDVGLAGTTSGASQMTLQVFAQDGDTSTAVNDETRRAAANVTSGASGHFISNIYPSIIIPVNASQVFKLTWAATNETGAAFTLYYRGFITNQ